MKVISLTNTNTNTNTLNLTVAEPVTIDTILGWNTVKEFAPEVTVDNVVSYDGNDLGALAGAVGNLSVTDDTVIEISVYGEHKPQAVSTPLQGKIEVIKAGGGLCKNVIIMSGVTTVRQTLNDRIANAFGKTRESLHNMEVYVNDVSASLDTVLKDRDVVTLGDRKAGDKGCNGPSITVIDGSGCTRDYEIDEDSEVALEEFLNTVLDETQVEDGVYTISAVDGQDFESLNDNFQEHVLMLPALDFEEVTIEENFLPGSVLHNFEDLEEDVVMADGVAGAQAVPAEGVITAGPVTVKQSNTEVAKVMVQSGKTTVRDVVMTSKVLNATGMIDTQMARMQFDVNDVRSDLDQVLRAGDTLVITAPACGQKGNL